MHKIVGLPLDLLALNITEPHLHWPICPSRPQKYLALQANPGTCHSSSFTSGFHSRQKTAPNPADAKRLCLGLPKLVFLWTPERILVRTAQARSLPRPTPRPRGSGRVRAGDPRVRSFRFHAGGETDSDPWRNKDAPNGQQKTPNTMGFWSIAQAERSKSVAADLPKNTPSNQENRPGATGLAQQANTSDWTAGSD